MQKDNECREGKHKLKSICDIKTFDELLSNCILSEDEITIIKMYYLEFKDFGFIADSLGYSYSTIKRRHKSAIKKLTKTMK